MMVYLAADRPLREVAWNKDAPGFHTSALTSDEERVRRQFTKPHVIRVGAYEGCACGFQLGEDRLAVLEQDEITACRRSLRDFAAYVRDEVARVGTVEVFACWAGDQEAPPEQRRSLSPSAFDVDNFFFIEKELSTIEADAVTGC